jgi:hypothetical protein
MQSLEGLESQLAKSCYEHLIKHGITAVAPTKNAVLAQDLMVFIAECNRRSEARGLPSIPAKPAFISAATINRDGEASDISRFLDDLTAQVLEVSGLPQVGKTAAIKKALLQAGVSSTRTITLNETSTADYMLFDLMKLTGTAPVPPYGDPVAVARGPALAHALRSVSVVCIENCHSLLDHGVWRDSPSTSRRPRVLGSMPWRATSPNCQSGD